MIEPEEDFQTWILIAISTIETPDKFAMFIPSIERLISSIIETDFLPESISSYTSLFIDKLNFEIERKILMLTQIQPHYIDQYVSFFRRIIEFGKYGIERSNEGPTRCAFTIIKHREAYIYKVFPSFESEADENDTSGDILQYAYNIGLYHAAYDKIASGPDQLFFLYLLFAICYELYLNDDDFIFVDFSAICANACLKIAKAQPRLNTKIISKIYSQIAIDASRPGNEIDSNYCDHWLDLFVHFIHGNIFEKQLFAFKEIQNMLFCEPIDIYAIQYFNKPDSLSILDLKTIHPELCYPISQILMKLAEHNFITNEILTKLWNQHSVQHSCDLSKFFVIFCSVSMTLSVDLLPKLVEQCVNSKNQNEEWMKFLCQMGKNIGERENTEESFVLIRTSLFSTALNPGPLQSIARNYLPSIIKFYLDSDCFDQIYRLFCDNQNEIKQNQSSQQQQQSGSIETLMFMYNLLGEAIAARPFEDKELATSILDQSISFLESRIVSKQEGEDYSLNNNGVVLKFIGNLISSMKIELNNEQLDKLFSLRSEETLINILSRLIQIDLIPLDHLEMLISNLPSNEINCQIFCLVRSIEFHCNKFFQSENNANGSKNYCRRYVSCLPLPQEDLMWKMACRNSSELRNFSILLCFFYTSNDGISLTDHEMMSTFIRRWNEVFPSSDKDAAIFLLRHFVNEIESKVDIESYNIKRHSSIGNTPLVHIGITGRSLPTDQSYDMPDNMYVSALIQRVSRISLMPLNSFVLTMNNHVLDSRKTLRQIAGNYHSISVVVQMVNKSQYGNQNNTNDTNNMNNTNDTNNAANNNNNGYNNYNMPHHIRECVPSQLIIQSSETVKMLIQLLKENNDEAKLLLNYLPTNSDTLFLIDEIYRCNTFNYHIFLPIEYPNVCLYNFEALIEKYNENFRDHFSRTGGFKYLIEATPKISDLNNSTSSQLTLKIIDFLYFSMDDEIKLNNSQHIFDVFIPFVVNVAACQPEGDTLFDSIVSFLTNLFQTCEQCSNGNENNTNNSSRKIRVPEDFSFVMNSLLLSPFDYVRNKTTSLLYHLTIPLTLFEVMIPSVTEDLLNSFYFAVLPHVDRPSEAIVNQIKFYISNPIPSLLSILDSMLEHNLIDECDQRYFCECLINRYLVVDSREKDKFCFNLAVKCLSKLRRDYLYDHLARLHFGRNQYFEWDIDGDSNIVSPTGHCGLENLGSTCFLNSTLQQFFAIPVLRNAILEYDQGDIFMIKLRNLYAEMYLSKGQLQNPKKLIKKWTGWDGEQMNPMIQQDAFEFTQMLIDKLEGGLTPSFINSLFGGSTIDRFEGISEEFSAENEQPFCTFTLPIQGALTTDDAFSQLQNPDFFTGENQYFAESLGHKIDAKKVASLRKLPPFLIIQLSRFEYNYEQGIRTKVNTVLHFPTVLDVKKNTSPLANVEQNTVYNLRGVIMHHGSADFGHYTSCIKDRVSNKWFIYNDSQVTEISEADVLENGSGSRTNHSNAYILFYDRSDVDYNLPTPNIPDDLVEKIAAENHKHDEYRLFCSEPYFEFMKLLAEKGEPRFVSIALKYYFDTFPFTLHIKRAAEIAPPICEKLKQSNELRDLFLEFLIEGPFLCSLVYCPSVEVRNGACQMIKSINPDKVPPEFLERIICIISTIIPYYKVFDQTFQLLENLVTRSKKLMNAAKQMNLGLHLMNLVARDIQQHAQQRDPDLFFMEINLTGIFSLLKHIDVHPNFVNYVLNDVFYKRILSSKTSIRSFVGMLKSFPNQERISCFNMKFAEKYGIYVKYTRIVSFLFQYFEELAFDIIKTCHFMVEQRSSNNLDLAYIICVLIRNYKCSIFLDHIDRWLFQLLTDEMYECRTVAEHAVSLLVPHKLFLDLAQFPDHELICNFGDLSVHPLLKEENNQVNNGNENNNNSNGNDADTSNNNNKYSNSDFIQGNANRILIFLLNNWEQFVNVCSDPSVQCYIGIQWINIVDHLCAITHSKEINFINNVLLNVAISLVPKKRGYDANLSRLYTCIINNTSIQLSDELLLSFFPPLELSRPASLALTFFEAMDGCAIKEFPDSFILQFVSTFCFTKNPAIISHYKIIASYLNRFSKMKPDVVYECIEENLDAFASNFLSGIIIALEAMEDKKLPLLNYLWRAVQMKQFFQLNEIVVRTFKVNRGNIDDILQIVSLLNSPNLAEDGRTCVWSLILNENPPFEEFSKIYKWKGDWVYLATFIERQREKSSIQLAVEASQNSLDAFRILFDFLVQNSAESGVELNSFVNSIFALTCESSPELATIYIEFLIKDGQYKSKDLLVPIIARLQTKLRFLNDLMNNSVENEVQENDVIPLLNALEVIVKFSDIYDSFQSEILNLRELCNKAEFRNAFDSADYEKFNKILCEF